MVGWFSGRISLIYMQFKVLLMIVALMIFSFSTVGRFVCFPLFIYLSLFLLCVSYF